MPFNHLYVLLELFPDRPWSWYCLSENPNLTWEIIKESPDGEWDWEKLSYNKFNKENAAIFLQRWWKKFSLPKKRHQKEGTM